MALGLRKVDLELHRNEFVAIIGESGSGKTTLLNVISGIDSYEDGEMYINGKETSYFSVEDMEDYRKNYVAFVFQSYNLIPVLSAQENTEFIMLLQNKPEAERNQRVKDLLAEVGLEGQEHKRPAQLSGGQQQRVAVARALASKPKFILADEPTANLDSKTAENLLDLMKKLNEEEGITFIFSTHDQRVIDRATRVITLVDGKVVSDEKK